MAETFRMAVERFKAEFLQQIKPGKGTVNLSLSTNYSDEEARAAGGASVEIALMLHRSVILNFGDEEKSQEKEKL